MLYIRQIWNLGSSISGRYLIRLRRIYQWQFFVKNWILVICWIWNIEYRTLNTDFRSRKKGESACELNFIIHYSLIDIRYSVLLSSYYVRPPFPGEMGLEMTGFLFRIVGNCWLPSALALALALALARLPFVRRCHFHYSSPRRPFAQVAPSPHR